MPAVRLPKTRQSASLLVGLCLVALLPLASAEASPVLYRFEGRGAGIVGAQPFNGVFVISLRGQSDDITDTSTSSQTGRSVVGSSTIELPGIGTARFTATMNLFLSESRFFDVANVGMGVTFADGGRKGIFGFTGTELFGHRLESGFGPFFAVSPQQLSQFNGVPTDLGDLSFSSMINTTYTTTAVPEPSTALLVGAALAGIGAIRRAPHPSRQSKPLPLPRGCSDPGVAR